MHGSTVELPQECPLLGASGCSQTPFNYPIFIFFVPTFSRLMA